MMLLIIVVCEHSDIVADVLLSKPFRRQGAISQYNGECRKVAVTLTFM